jgi:ABC-type bacteriocin/lantibiotic exporter with double-glycine peptidase domain
MQNPYLNLLSFSWKYSKPHRRKYVLVYAGYTVVALIDTSKPILYGWFISHLEKDFSQTIRYTLLYVFLYLSIILVEWSIKGSARIAECSLAFKIGKNFSMETISKVLNMPLKWHSENHSGMLVSRIRKSGTSLSEFFKNGFSYYLSFLKLIISLFSILYFSPLFGGISVLIGILTILFILKIDKVLVGHLSKYNEKDDKINAVVSESMTNIKTVAVLRLGTQIKNSISLKIEEAFDSFIKFTKKNETKWFVADISVSVIYVICILGYVLPVYYRTGAVALGPLVTLVLYVNQFTAGFHSIAWLYNQIVQLNTNVTSVGDISSQYDHYKINDTADYTVKLPDKWNYLEISALNFSFTETARQSNTLHNISIKLRKGKKIALIGKTGGGKSTLLALLRGLYNPRTGVNLKVNDDQLSHCLEMLNNDCTLIPQEPEIFENTLLYNLTFGAPYTENEVYEACATAHFAEVVDQLPLGLNTLITENGANFSGGQRQRLALARGILAAKNSNIVLIDEPTSSIDPALTLHIYKQLFFHFKEKALVVSLHHLDLLPLFDYIYVIEQGKIVESGTFEQLTKTAFF